MQQSVVNFDKEIVLNWLKERDIIVLTKSADVEGRLSVKLIELVGEINNYKE